MFNGNNYGNPELDDKTVISTLDGGFYTTAAVVKGYGKFVVDRGMLVGFLVLQGVVVVFVWGVLGWVWLGRGGGRRKGRDSDGREREGDGNRERGVGRGEWASSFVVFDAAVRVELRMEEPGAEEVQLEVVQRGFGDGKILGLAAGARAFVRSEREAETRGVRPVDVKSERVEDSKEDGLGKRDSKV